MRNVSKEIILDIHLCVDRPARYVKALADAGASRIIFQWEAMIGDNAHSDSSNIQVEQAQELAKTIVDNGMRCGISINPNTKLDSDIFSLLETGFVDTVDLLAVEPGFGGQVFQQLVLAKIQELKNWINSESREDSVKIMIDGGINTDTSKRVRDISSSNLILVAGTFLFRHKVSMEQGARDLLA